MHSEWLNIIKIDGMESHSFIDELLLSTIMYCVVEIKNVFCSNTSVTYWELHACNYHYWEIINNKNQALQSEFNVK